MIDPPLGLYVHVPFCEAKCSYCHFAIDPRRPDEERQERYVRAVLGEIERATDGTRGRERPRSRSRSRARERADTLYFGGGTPSLLSRDRLARILEALSEGFELTPAVEVALEANPRDLDAAGYRALRACGVTRLSLGVQALDDGVLREMGRLHTAADARAAFDSARRAGFASVSLDLILGWPGETRERWGRVLAAAREMAPDHVSLYVLEVEGKNVLAHRARRGELRLPEDDLVADLYLATVEALGAQGLERYEISNFARPGHESRHNAKYWDDTPFLGFGMAAHSYRGGRRFWNLETYFGYCCALEQGRSPVAGERVLTPEQRRAEALFTGLRRRDGVDLADFRARHGRDPLEDYAAALREPFEAGLLEQARGRLRLTKKGVLLSNEVFRAFV